tara:strand:- start:1185 stop:1499 length:315 start_codon:yes stop_codon:yes gene_type:complete
MRRQKYFWGGIISAVAPAVIGGLFGGGGNGGGQAQSGGGGRGESILDTFMKMDEASRARTGKIEAATQKGKQANQEIVAILQQELANAYRDPKAAAHRIFKDYV